MSEITQRSEDQQPNDDRGYEFALQLAFYEGQISWQMNVLFVGLNIGIGTILQNKLEHFSSFDPLTIIMSLVGLVINTYWLGTFLRNNKYYDFRMAQARYAEPEGYSLVNGRGYRFSRGKSIDLPETNGDKDSDHKLNWFEKKCSNKNAIKASIFCFLGGSFLLLVLSLIPCLEVIKK